MRLKTFICTAALLALALFSSCAAQEKTAKPGEEFQLKIGDTAGMPEESLRIKFLDVISDSRCPRSVQCIWAGEAELALEVEKGGSKDRILLKQPGLTPEALQDYGGYEIRFSLEPYPEQPGKKIAKEDYVLKITIRKAKLKL